MPATVYYKLMIYKTKGIGTIIGGAPGGIGSGLFVNIKLNEFFDEYRW